MLETHLRQAATALLEYTIRIAPMDTREWGEGMLGELRHVDGAWAAVGWSLGGASVLAKAALGSILIPGRRGQGIAADGGLFARRVSLSKAALTGGAVCVLGAMLFFLAPPFRQAVRVSLGAWADMVSTTARHGQPRLTALAKRAEAGHDAHGLLFAAARLNDGRESARLAEEAVRLDPTLAWVYAVVAVRHPELPEIPQWVSELERRDLQNALPHFITAETIDLAQVSRAARLSPREARKQSEEGPAWQRAMAAAFASPKFDDYLDRLSEVDRRVIAGYRFREVEELLSSDQAGLPGYAFSDSRRFAEGLLDTAQQLEAQGDRKGALEKYWAVARFGQVMDSQAHTDEGQLVGATLQTMAYKQLARMSTRDGRLGEAGLFSYLQEKFDPQRGERARLEGRILDQEIVSRNAAVLQISSLLMIVFCGLIALAGSVLILSAGRGVYPAYKRAKPVATVVALAGAVGFLLSSATVYLTYRPYWYIFQTTVLSGEQSRAHHDLQNLLMAIRGFPGGVPDSHLVRIFPVYFWTGVTLLSVIGLVLMLLRHFLGRPRAKTAA